MAKESLLEVEDLRKHFPVGKTRPAFGIRPTVKAVDGVSFQLNEGETLALVGESGCGKTTLARLILQLETLTSGVVRINGRDVSKFNKKELKGFRSNVQAVFQDPWSSLNPRMRVRDIVSEPLIVNHRISRNILDEKVAKVLEDVGLHSGLASNFPHEFSGGQRQRIAIASALISNPRLIVLDEPVSALDVSIRSQIMNLFKDLQTKYRFSYLLVAHDLATTRYLADYIAVMYLGKIVEIAPTESIFEGPKHPYTKALFSSALPDHPNSPHQEILLEGEVPSPLDPPSGCPFHPRCAFRFDNGLCEREFPSQSSFGGGHRTNCHLY